MRKRLLAITVGCLAFGVTVTTTGCATRASATAQALVSLQSLYSPAGSRDQTRFELWCEGDEILFRFETKDETPCLVPHAAHERDLEAGDRLEVYLSPRQDLTDWYYCLEFDLLGQILDYRAKFYRQMDYAWQCPTLRTRATRRGDTYTVEARISRSALAQRGLILDRCFLGVFRADAQAKGKEPDWYSAVPFPAGEADFHRPVMLDRVTCLGARSKASL